MTALAAALTNVAVQQGARGFTLADLTRPAEYQGATVGQLVAWLTQAQADDLIEDIGFDRGINASVTGSRRYRITPA
jgi:hypothetical protein